MTATPLNHADRDVIEEISILFFECCLALDMALKASRELANQPAALPLQPQLQELAQLLEICDGRFTLLTEKLDIAFYVPESEAG